MPLTELHLRGRIVAPSAGLDDGVITVTGDRISAITSYSRWQAAEPGRAALPHHGMLLPGLVDIHNHGGGGYEFASTKATDARRAAEYHHRRGTTSVVASIVTAPAVQLLAQLRLLRELANDGTIAGIHCEGPFLSAARCGAQDPRYLRTPSQTLTAQLLAAAGGALRVLTLAPELPGFAAAAAQLAAAGVTIALGHSDASYADFAAALAPAGPATLVTHLANGMPPLHHRAPGPVAASLTAAARGDVTVELIADGVHVSAGFAELVCAVAPDRTAIVTDALAAAGMPDGNYRLGPQAILVRGGVARAGNGALAGGTRDALAGVAWLVQECGVPLPAAVRAATLVPATAAGIDGAGDLRPGMLADVIAVSANLTLKRVLRRGQWLS